MAYFYKLTPFFAVTAICVLALPWLGLIALFVVSLLVLPALFLALVYAPYRVGRAITDSLQGHGASQPQSLGGLTR